MVFLLEIPFMLSLVRDPKTERNCPVRLMMTLLNVLASEKNNNTWFTV